MATIPWSRSQKTCSTLRTALRTPKALWLEEYVEGIDVTVGYIHGVGHNEGILMPVEHMVERSARHFNVYDYRLKNLEPGGVQMRCPASIPRDVGARMRCITKDVVRCLSLRDLARIDYRISEDGRIYLLEANALPSLAANSSLFLATSQLGLQVPVPGPHVALI